MVHRQPSAIFRLMKTAAAAAEQQQQSRAAIILKAYTFIFAFPYGPPVTDRCTATLAVFLCWVVRASLFTPLALGGFITLPTL